MIAIQTVEVCADVWRPMCHEDSSTEVFHSWAMTLRHHLDAEEVGIWSCDETGEPALEGYARRTLFDVAPFTQHPAIADSVRSARTSRQPLVLAGSEQDWQLTEYPALEGPESVIAILVPIRVNEQLFGLIALRFAANAPAPDLWSITSLSAQMGWGLALLQRQARLRRCQRSHERLVATAPCAVIQLGTDSKVLAWNPGAERLFGWRAADVQGRCLPTLSCGASDPFTLCWEGALGGRATKRIETKATTYTGECVDIALAAAPQFNEHGAVESVLLVAEAIGDRKRAERLAQLQNRVTQILARGTDVDETVAAVLALLCSEYGWACGEFWTADREGRRFKRQTSAHLSAANAVHFDREMTARGERTDELAVRVSGALQAVWFSGFSADRSIERAFLAAQCSLHDALGIRIVYGRELIGAIVFVAEQIEKPDAQLLAWLDALGEQVGQFVSHRRTEESLRAADQKLFQSQKLETVGRLVGGVAHDFNNLMTVILGYGELLLDGQVDAELVHDAHREILDAGKHAALLTRRLLAFSRKETVHPVSFNLNTVIEQLEMMIRRLIGPNIQLRFALAPSLREVCADPAQVEQTLMNLVVNARDAMPTGGQLTICTRDVEIDRSSVPGLRDAAPGPYVVLSVSDTGCGIADDVQERLFDPFFSTKPAANGTGIGLSTVQDNMRRCNGQIVIESKPGRGTLFDLYFPATFQAMASWVVDSPPEPVPSGRETILVVDDEVRVQRLIALVLRTRGYNVLEAGGAKKALEIVRHHSGRINLVIADLVLSGANGITLTDRLAKERPDAAVLWMSGYVSADMLCEITDGEPRPFLHKPFTSFELASTVRQILDA
jgi:PAS domain S-box-containing protein